MKVRIEIDTKTFVRFWLVVIGFGLAGLAIYSARTALVILGAAFFLAVALSNPVGKLAQKMPGKSRVGGTAVAFVLIVVFIGGFIGLIVPPVIEQTVKVIDRTPQLIESAQDNWHVVNDLIQKYHLQSQVDNSIDNIKDKASEWAANIGTSVVTSVSSLFSVLAAVFLTLVLAFLMLIEGPRWVRMLWGVYEDEDRRASHERLMERMHSVVSGYVTGQLAVSGVGALASGMVVFCLHFIFPEVAMSLALPTMAIAFIFSLIPMFGATIAGVLIALLLAFSDVTAAIVFVVYFIVYQQIENNFISPTIQSKTVELSALAVLAAVTIGLYVFGLAGGIISIPIAGCIKVLLEDHFEKKSAIVKKRSTRSVKLARGVQKKIEQMQGEA